MRLGIAAAAVIGVGAFAATAAAASGVEVAPTGMATWPNRELIVSLPSGQRVQGNRFTIRENGQPVLGQSVGPATAQGTFGAILVIDTSNSMHGAPIKGAIDAARTFAAQRNVNQRLAVLTFNSSTHQVLPFTSSQSKIDSALARQPRLALGTHLYDAAAQAVKLAQAQQLTSAAVILLSDGADTGSNFSLDEAAKVAQGAHIRIFTVGLHSSTFRPAALQQLATLTGGSFSQASTPKDLAVIFNQLGLKLAHQYIVTYKSLVLPGRDVRVSVSVAGIGRTGLAYTAPQPPTVSLRQPLANRIWRSWETMLIICLFVAALVGGGLFALLRPQGSTVRRRLSDFVSTTGQATEQPRREPLASRLFEGTEQSLERTQWWQAFKEGLELADIRIPPVQLLVGTLVLTLLFIWALATFVAGILGLVGLAVPFAVRGLIMYKIEKKRRAFGDQLPDNLDVVASGLRAGHSLVGGLSLVVNDAAEPSKSEFQRVVADEQLGVPLEDALSVVARRMKSRDVEQVALVSSLQRETGSNSAEVLDRVIESIRERAALRRLVRSLTAQGRMSRWVVTFLPVGLLLAISAINPTYMRPLFTHTSGRVVLTIGAIMIISGSLLIKKIVNIKV